jgi:hypothetical protein
MTTTFQYGTARVRDLAVMTGERSKQGLPRVHGIELDGEVLTPTRRFWRSFFKRFQISDSMFRFFSYEEVLERVTEQSPCERFQFCIERKPNSTSSLLAATAPDRSITGFEEVKALLERYDGQNLKYSKGVISSTHVPTSGDGKFQIGGDEFKNRFVLETPIDGYGLPKIHLSLLRMLCSNGAVGYSRAFRTQINTGKDPLHGISRALDTYDNDNGYAALWQRFESAQNSWASIREIQTLYSLLLEIGKRNGFTSDGILKRFYSMSGRPHELYGIANLDAFSQKRQRVLPAKCRVYDLLNFASEVATHQSTAEAGLQLQGYIGSLVSDEYDMEGTAERVIDFQDFFVGPPAERRFSVN